MFVFRGAVMFGARKPCYQPHAKTVVGQVHQETYGKTGCRRIIPGEFLAVDPKGRAFLLAAVEKQKSARAGELREPASGIWLPQVSAVLSRVLVL